MERKKLVENLEYLLPAISSGDIVPAFQCCRIKNDRAMATDGIVSVYRCLGEDTNLDCAVPAKALVSLLKAIGDEDIELIQEEDRLLVKAKKILGSFLLLAESELLSMSDYSQYDYAEMDKEFGDALSFCSHGVAKSSDMGPISGIWVADKFAYSTDRYRAIRYDMTTGQEDMDCIIPLKFAQLISKYREELGWMAKDIRVDENLILARGKDDASGFYISTTLVSGKFPDLSSYFENLGEMQEIIFPTKLNKVIDKHIEFQRETEDFYKEIFVRLEGDQGRIISRGLALGELEESIVFTNVSFSEPFDFVINPILLREISKVCDTFFFSDALELVAFITEKALYLVKLKSIK